MSSIKCQHSIQISKRFNPSAHWADHSREVRVGIRELFTGEGAGTGWFLNPDQFFFTGVFEVIADFVPVNCCFLSLENNMEFDQDDNFCELNALLHIVRDKYSSSICEVKFAGSLYELEEGLRNVDMDSSQQVCDEAVTHL